MLEVEVIDDTKSEEWKSMGKMLLALKRVSKNNNAQNQRWVKLWSSIADRRFHISKHKNVIRY